MSRASHRVTLPEETVSWFFETFEGEVTLSYILQELLESFRQAYEENPDDAISVLNRIKERLAE